MAGSYVAQGSGQTFTVSSTIVIHVTSTTQGPLGLDLGGGTIVSNITNGAPVIQVVVDPGVDLRYLTFSNLTIQGNGKEGDGIQIVAAGNDRWVYNFSVNNVTVNHVGGYGLDVQGSVFEGLVSNSWMNNDGKGGAYFSHLDGGQVSAVRWFGGGFQNNGGAGLMLDNGARDMSVDSARFVGNAGGGISAGSGITSVSNSDFQDNHGSGVWIQNYGNFDNNTFESTGAQTVGITGWLNGEATVVGNTSTWHGSGSDPTTLANLQGYGYVYATGDHGNIVTGSSLSVSSLGGGDAASITHSSSGISLPSLSAVTAATTTAPAATSTANPVETALKAAAGGAAQHLTSPNYSVTSPIVVHLTSADQGPINIDFGGAKIQSNISNGSPVIEIVVDRGVNVSQLTISNLMINGNGSEGDGIKIVADGTDRSIQNLSINSVNVEHVGGIGLDVIGNVHGTIFDSWMNGNNGGGARFANGANGGVADGLAWTGGGFRKNGVAGLILDNGTHDMTVTGAYFVENTGVGIDATSGITLVKQSGFENNGGTAVVVNGTANFVNDTFSTWGPQQTAIGGYLNGGTVSLSGINKEYYGSSSDTSVVANFQGSGTVALAGSDHIVAGPGITVTGSGLTASNAGGVPAGLTSSTANSTTAASSAAGTTTAAPVVIEMLVSDTGSLASDGITSSAALKGTADAGATVHFTVDGTAVAVAATANASGAWTFAPTGLSEGRHTIVASETNASGQTGSASLTFTLDTKAPAVTEALVGGGTSSSTGALTGTAPPNAVVKFTVDGTAVTGTATADASGNWSYTPSGLSAGTHTVMASSTDVAGNTGSASLTFTTSTGTASGTGSSGTGTDTGAIAPPSGTAPVFTGGSYANGQVTVTGTTPAANETVWIYDGSNWAGWTTSDASGHFTFSEAAAAGSSHSFGAIAIDSLGNMTKTASAFAYAASTAATSPSLATATPPPPAAGGLPVVTEHLVSDTGASATDGITSNAALAGTADAGTSMHFTVDGSSVAATATADASGHWTFTPSGLSDGFHTVIASETNA
ncbi:MAG: right-handed parallel beta-helix repeat-containing protein, partial [Proteobacteria bacterium]|nr:right-handed parallel beta-helix repeat-containing protein [Pseudomonadota bacterium]